MPTRSEQRRINIQQGRPMNEGLEPVTTEYIERETVVAFLENMAASRYLIQCFENKEKFPAKDVVEVRHGEWVEHSQPDAWGYSVSYTCSVCGKEKDDNTDSYCSDCGAKMDGKEN